MQDLQNKPNISQMFNIQEKENGEIAISGRELHEALEIKTEYKKWFSRMTEYGFEENIDYTRVTQNCLTRGGYQNITDHALTLDTAKEIAMIQSTTIFYSSRESMEQSRNDNATCFENS